MSKQKHTNKKKIQQNNNIECGSGFGGYWVIFFYFLSVFRCVNITNYNYFSTLYRYTHYFLFTCDT